LRKRECSKDLRTETLIFVFQFSPPIRSQILHHLRLKLPGFAQSDTARAYDKSANCGVRLMKVVKVRRSFDESCEIAAAKCREGPGRSKNTKF
jgi:hypothetical protein